MNSSLRRFLHSHQKLVVATSCSAVTIGFSCYKLSPQSRLVYHETPCTCDSGHEGHLHNHHQQQQKEPQSSSTPVHPELQTRYQDRPLWKRWLARIGFSSLPRSLTQNDSAFRIPKRFLRKRIKDEEKMRKLVTEDVPNLAGKPDFEDKIALLRKEIFQLAYGKGVTAQMREDFLIRYGCTGFNDTILSRLVELCSKRGIVEVGAGHGQWQKALTDAYISAHDKTGNRRNFDFVLAYDNNSNLPLNTHIYNQYTRPHHEYFGAVKKLESMADLSGVLRSWQIRGRALLLVYPPPGSMAIETLSMYSNASPENDILIYVGEGRGGANANEEFFDFLEKDEWILLDILAVLRPPGDKGCEQVYILQKPRTKD